MYIAHDDNWGSNFCIPKRFLHPNHICKLWPDGPRVCPEDGERVAYVIGTFPKDIRVSAISAEAIAADFLFSMLGQLPPRSEAWDRRLTEYAKANLLVLRPILIHTRDYVEHLAQIQDWEGQSIKESLIRDFKDMDDQKLWLVELSIPELFSANRRKVGEVLIQAEGVPGTKRDFSNFIFARLPSYFVLYESGGVSNPEYSFVPSGVHSHTSLYDCE
jgi:hypothetical protein